MTEQTDASSEVDFFLANIPATATHLQPVSDWAEGRLSVQYLRGLASDVHAQRKRAHDAVCNVGRLNRQNATIVARARRLCNVQRKTLRMDDLAAALQSETCREDDNQTLAIVTEALARCGIENPGGPAVVVLIALYGRGHLGGVPVVEDVEGCERVLAEAERASGVRLSDGEDTSRG